jgi:hypothetical protein
LCFTCVIFVQNEALTDELSRGRKIAQKQ